MSELQTTAAVVDLADRLASAQPGHWVSARLRDGTTARLRPLGAGETEPLLAVFAAMSDQSRTLRYLSGMSRLPASMLSVLSDVDGQRHVAWLATVDGKPVGIARYVRLPGCPTTAELAFEVADHLHGRGLATILLDTVTTVAAARGVRRVQGTMDPSNAASRRLLERVGARARPVDGLVEAEGRLRLLDQPVVDRAAVVEVADASTLADTLDIG
jgi:RimJ/RimL family protein N-acetyltransferase